MLYLLIYQIYSFDQMKLNFKFYLSIESKHTNLRPTEKIHHIPHFSLN